MSRPTTSSSRRPPLRRALLIGVAKYSNPAIGALSGADLNHTLLAPELARRGFTTTPLLNEAATRCAITAAIADLIKSAEPGDVCLIAYSGHGNSVADPDTDEPDGANEFIYPYDAGPFAAAIRDDELAAWLKEARPGVSIYCLFDACHSGTMSDGFLPFVRRWWWRTWRFFRRVPFWFRRRVAGGRAMVFSACRDNEEADYSQLDRGRFTDVLVDALAHGALASNQALGQHLVQSFEARGYRDQHPEFRGPPQALSAGIFERY